MTQLRAPQGETPRRARRLAAGPRSEESLLQAVAGGDRQAFAALYDRVAPAVYGMARRVVVDPTTAEDITQEVLLGVWAKAAGFDPVRGSARAWILTMAHRRAVDFVRSEQASRNRLDRVAAASTQRPFDEVAEAAVDNVTAASDASAVNRALGALSDLQRAAVELAYFQGMSYPEVARTLDVPLGTAKTRIRDGVRRLAVHLGPTARDGESELRVPSAPSELAAVRNSF